MKNEAAALRGDLLKRTLEAPLKDLDALLSTTGDYVDAVSALGTHNEQEFDVMPRGREFTVQEQIHQRLGHLVANPSRMEDKNALLKSYLFSGLEGTGAMNKIANASALSARNFVEDVLAAARRAHQFRRNKLLGTAQQLESVNGFVLHGPRGVGKTLFYNFVLSEFDARFDDPKDPSIWIRLNLVDPLYDADSPNFGAEQLTDWIYGQTAKVILRYYDPESAYFRPGKNISFRERPFLALERHFLQLARQNTIDNAALVEKATLRLDRIKSTFLARGHDEMLTQSLMPTEYGKFLYDRAQDEGYSIVIVFDGLDILEMTQSGVGKYRRIFNAVYDVCRADDLTGAAYVSIMRTNSLRQDGHPYRSADSPEYEVRAPRLDAIVERRIAFIGDEVRDWSRTRFPNWASDPILTGWPGHLNDFLNFLFPSVEDPNDGFALLSLIFDHDRRAQMQAVKLRYLEFLKRRSESSYRLMEILSKGGMIYPPTHYKYELGPGEKPLRSVGDRVKGGDARFFPSIFAIPQIPGNSRADLRLNEESLLAGLRILQIVEAHGRLRSRDRMTEPLRVASLAYIVEVLFGCPRIIVQCLIEEYVEFQMLRTYGRFGPTDTFERDDVHMLPKGSYILNLAIYQIAYLNLAAMRARLSVQAFDRENPFILPAIYAPEKSRGLEHWVCAKVTNSISICRLVTAINLKQRQEFYGRTLKLNDRPLYSKLLEELGTSKIFDDIRKISSEVLPELGAAITSLEFPDNRYDVEFIETGISAYAETWC